MTKLQVSPLDFRSENGVDYVAYRVENYLPDSGETFWLSVGDDHKLGIEAGPQENPYGRFAFRAFKHRSVGDVHDVRATEAVWVNADGDARVNHHAHFWFMTADYEGVVISRDQGDINKAERMSDTAWGLVPVKQ